jgi:hypothetical protein
LLTNISIAPLVETQSADNTNGPTIIPASRSRQGNSLQSCARPRKGMIQMKRPRLAA